MSRMFPGRAVVRALTWVIMLSALSACRAAAPATGRPYHQERITRTTLASDTGATFTSTSSDLTGMRDSMRSSLRFGGNPFVSLGWRLEASTEEFTPGVDLSHRSATQTLAVPPIDIGNLGIFTAELAALNTDPTLAALTGGVTVPPIPMPSILEAVQIEAALDGTRTFWLPASAPGITNATLHFDFPLQVTPDPIDEIDAFFDIRTFSTPVNVDITATPCGTCAGRTCRDSGFRTHAGYRSALAVPLGYAAGDVDAIYPNQGLDFTTAVTGSPRISGGVGYTALCPFALGTLPTLILTQILPPVPGIIELIQILQGTVGTPFAFIAGLIACTFAAAEIRQDIDAIVLGIPPTLGPPVDLLVNPPTLVVPLARAAAVPVAGLLPPFIVARASVGIGLSVPGPFGGTIALTNADGSINDAFYNSVATGAAGPGAATITAVTINMQPVIDACGTGIGLTPAAMTDCLACNPGGACLGTPTCGNLCAPGGGFLPTVNVALAGLPLPTITIAPAPRTAAVLSGLPVFAETVRRWFANPLPAGARYTATAPGATPGDADFSYIVDPDGDCVSVESDVCTSLFNPAQIPDGDGDIYGAECDLCPGIAESGPAANGDDDADGTANGCDCDIDSDGCNNRGFAFDGSGGIVACGPGPDGIFDRRTFHEEDTDFDADGIPDQCDNDRDEDGILDDDPDPLQPDDNCPLGDGDGVWEPGATQDQNPDQTNSGGPRDGDVCDPLGTRAAAGPAGFAAVSFDRIPGMDICTAGIGGLCDLGLFLECEGAEYDECWQPDRFDSVVLVDLAGQIAQRIDPAQLGLGGGISRNVSEFGDLDGDGFGDYVIAAPRAGQCPPQQPCDALRRGAVGLVSSSTGLLVARLDGPTIGGGFGAGMAAFGDALAIGAPGEAGGAGAVYLYRVVSERAGARFELRRRVQGTAAGDAFGSDIEVASSTAVADPVFLVGAPGARSGAGELALLDASRGVADRFAGPVAGGHLTRGLVLTGAGGRAVVVGALPDAFSGAGAVVFFRGRGSPRVRRGTAGARLGEAIVAYPRGGELHVVVSAPGGVGALVEFDAAGRIESTTSGVGSLFGTALAAPGDFSGDGQVDLMVSFAVDETGDDFHTVPIFELAR